MCDAARLRVLVIVPAYNESGNLEKVVADLRAASVDFVVVNDGSTDDTEDVLVSLGAPHVTLCQNLGIGGAMQAGYKYACRGGYDAAVQFDGDGQHDAACLGALVAPLAAGEADVVVGSRFLGGENRFKSSAARRFGIRCLSLVLRLVTGRRILDVTSGFRAMGREAMEMFAERYPVDYPEPESLATALTAGLRVVEVPVVMHARAEGVSSIKGGFSAFYYMVKVGTAILLSGSRRGGRR